MGKKKDDFSVDIDLRAKDLPDLAELMLAVQNGCTKLVEEAEHEETVFWAERILQRLEVFSGKDKSGGDKKPD